VGEGKGRVVGVVATVSHATNAAHNTNKTLKRWIFSLPKAI
jgi:hypothetical protein